MHALWDGNEHTDLVAGSGIDVDDRGGSSPCAPSSFLTVWGSLLDIHVPDLVPLEAIDVANYLFRQDFARLVPDDLPDRYLDRSVWAVSDRYGFNP